jgi:hypothetical protein
MRRSSRVLLLAGLASTALAAPAAAQLPAAVALALEVSGGRVAGVEPFREIAAGTTVSVPPGVRFVFQHYGSCRKFTLVGGTATFRTDGVDITGTRPTDARTPCPRKITLRADGASAGVVMRSLGAPRVVVPARPQFVVVGPRATEFSLLRVRRGSEILVEHALGGGRSVRWPPHVPPLDVPAHYELELVPAGDGRPPVVVGIRTEASAADEAMTLVSAE